MKRFTVLPLATMVAFLFLTCNVFAIERVVILAPAAADVVFQLGAESSVVGVTNSVTEFPKAEKVGTHLNPGIEKVASLKPTLIVANTRFDAGLAKRMGAELFVYEPQSLDEIVESVRLLGQKIDKEATGRALAESLKSILDNLRVPSKPLTVLYETRSTPLAIAKEKSIIKNLLERAGLRYAYPRSTGMISAEYLLANQPDIYIYQQGPMNKNPVPPRERAGWERLQSCLWKVNEFDFARANTQLFTTVVKLNEILHADNPCEAGIERFAQ